MESVSSAARRVIKTTAADPGVVLEDSAVPFSGLGWRRQEAGVGSHGRTLSCTAREARGAGRISSRERVTDPARETY